MRRVLVLEDDPNLLALLTEILQGGGYKPVPFSDGKQAWEALQKDPTDLAVLDVNVPGITGLELMRRVRRHTSLHALPVLMLTVKSAVKDQVRGYERGADDYLTKPFMPDVLLARLRALERRVLDARA